MATATAAPAKKEVAKSGVYVEGKVTVMCNETGGLLLVGDIMHPTTKQPLQLQPGESVDLEDFIEPKEIKRSRVHQLVREGRVSFHAKGSEPTGKILAQENVPGSYKAPPNAFDDRINQDIDKQKKDDEKTKGGQQQYRRASTGGGDYQHDERKVAGQRPTAR